MKILIGFIYGLLAEIIFLISFAVGSSPIGTEFRRELEQYSSIRSDMIIDSACAFYFGIVILLIGAFVVILIIRCANARET